jgi:hypothetical protein
VLPLDEADELKKIVMFEDEADEVPLVRANTPLGLLTLSTENAVTPQGFSMTRKPDNKL